MRLLIQVPRLPVAVSEITPDPLEDALRLLMRLRVSLRDAWVRAGVRITLRPLLHRLPVVGAVQVQRGSEGGGQRGEAAGWAGGWVSGTTASPKCHMPRAALLHPATASPSSAPACLLLLPHPSRWG